MQIEQIAAKLEELGLSDKEARVYVANLFLGPSSVQKIAEQARINRPTAYVILDQLTELGLVSQSIESKKTLFIAEPPEALGRLLERQKQIIDERQKELRSLLPELMQVERTQRASAPAVRFYRGLEGIKSINAYMRRKSKPGTVVYGLSDLDEIIGIFPDILKENPDFRVHKKLASKLLYSSKNLEHKSDPKYLRQTIKLPITAKADITLYEEGASLLTYAGKDSVGVVIESSEIVQALRQLFELAWEAAALKSKKIVKHS